MSSDETDARPLDGLQEPSRTGRVLLVGAVMGALAAATLIAGLVVRDTAGVHVPALAIMAALLLGLKLLVDRLARWAAPSQGVVITSLGAAGLAPLFFLGGLWAMSDPIVRSSWWCGTDEMTAIMLAPIAFFLAGTLGTLCAAGVLGAGRGEALRPLIRGAALIMALAAAALVVLSAVRAVRKPDIDRYVASLPVIATLPPVGGEGLAPRPPSQAPDAPEVPVRADIVGDVTVYRACWTDTCDVALGDAAAARKSLPIQDLRTFGNPSTAILVRRDEAHHFVVLEGSGRMAFCPREHFAEEFAGSGRAPPRWRPIDVGVRDVAGSASPPLGWILGGAAGLLAAGALLAISARRSKRIQAVIDAAPGVLGDNGWIHFEDGRPSARVDPAAGIPEGPVLLIQDTGSPGAYRESGLLGAAQVVAGTRAEWQERAEASAADLSSWALCAASLGAAPLAAAMSAGLVI
jgi:hypothetical protein